MTGFITVSRRECDMSLDVSRAIREGLGRTATRNGVLLVVAFALIGLLNAVAFESAAARMVELAAEMDPEAATEIPEGSTPLALPLPGAVILFLILVWLLAWAATSVVTVRIMATDRVDSIPEDLVVERLAAASANEIAARIVVFVLIGFGLVAFVLPGIFLAICFYFTRPYIAIDDRNVVDGMVESWRLSKGDRFDLFVLLIGAVVVYALIALSGVVATFALTGFPVVASVVGTVFSAVATVFWLSTSARAFVQLFEPEDEESEPSDEWDDPPGVEW